MEFKVHFNGTPAQFGVVLEQIENTLVGAQGHVPFLITERITPTINPIWVHLTGPEKDPKLYGHLSAHTVPGGAILTVRVPDDEWPLVEPGWNLIQAELESQGWLASASTPLTRPKVQEPYVDMARIAELQAIHSLSFDLTKRIQLCLEINKSYDQECFLAVAMLVRAILDHIPPIFGYKHFTEVANSYAGAKSFKESMQHLEQSSRKIADAHLHIQIRSKETLPTKTQVRFFNDLDVLLSEIVRILK